MCIIVAKKTGITMPTINTLQTCFDHNNDGAGIMLSANGKVYGWKGLMTFEAFKKKLGQIQKKFGNLTNNAVVMHFRIGTHGTNIPANTHPFPISTNYNDLRKTEFVVDQAICHNGIISAFSSHPDIRKENVSDTMAFIKRMVAPVGAKMNVVRHRDILEGFQYCSGGRLTFLDGKGRLECIGDFIEDNGVLYSNGSYIQYTWKKPIVQKGGWYDDYDYGYYGYKPQTSYIGSAYYNGLNSRKSRLTSFEDQLIMKEEAEESGLIQGDGTVTFTAECKDGVMSTKFTNEWAVDSEGDMYSWNYDTYSWDFEFTEGEYEFDDDIELIVDENGFPRCVKVTEFTGTK